MGNITFVELMQAAQKLSPEQKAALIYGLKFGVSLNREQLIAELEALRTAGVESVYGNYARPGVEVSEETLNDFLHRIATDWESELDDYAP